MEARSAAQSAAWKPHFQVFKCKNVISCTAYFIWTYWVHWMPGEEQRKAEWVRKQLFNLGLACVRQQLTASVWSDTLAKLLKSFHSPFPPLAHLCSEVTYESFIIVINLSVAPPTNPTIPHFHSDILSLTLSKVWHKLVHLWWREEETEGSTNRA